MKTTFERVREILVEQLGVDAEIVKPQSFIAEDLGSDSLDVQEIKLELEDEFSVLIEEEDSDRVRTVQDVVEMVERLQRE